MFTADQRKMFEDYKQEIEEEYVQIGYFNEENQFFLDQCDFKIIYKTFDKFYLNKLSNTRIRNQRKKPKKLTFKPNINKRSQKIYKKTRKKLFSRYQ